MFDEMKKSADLVRSESPVVLNITNYVTMDFMANALLAIGASPIMSEDKREIADLMKFTGAVNINIGTLSESFEERANAVCVAAATHRKPIVLDPVGAGASRTRDALANKLLNVAEIVRGNASEILALHGVESKTKGVDSAHAVQDAVQAAKALSENGKRIIAVSGPEDYITDGTHESRFPYGSSMMPKITGMGCTLTAVIAAFRAVVDDPYKATEHATAYFGLCGQLAEQKSAGPGSFRMNFIDTLHAPDWAAFQKFHVK